MKVFIRYLTFFVLFIVFGFEISEAGTARKRFRKTYRFKSGSELILENTNGSIDIDTWNKNEALVEAEIRVKAKSRREAEDFLELVEILVEKSRYGLEIRSYYPKRFRRHSIFDFFRKPSVIINYVIRIPENADLSIETTNGSIYISRVEGKIEARSTNGKINLKRVRGSVKAHTTNGSIEAELIEVQENEDMEFSTTNGGIKVYFPGDLKADLYARTTNGSIYTDFPVRIRGRWNRRKLQGRINGGGAYIELRTTNGSIKILEI
ncbi:hypothetical protein DRQ09_09685 [candidate division KSB1 bacterium]|nr:MAG: hypothetical protein DRQ09_09685 [candidate division KSB1 bacterium]